MGKTEAILSAIIGIALFFSGIMIGSLIQSAFDSEAFFDGYEKGFEAGYAQNYIDTAKIHNDSIGECDNRIGQCFTYFFSFRNRTDKDLNYADNYYYVGIEKQDLQLIETETEWIFRPLQDNTKAVK